VRVPVFLGLLSTYLVFQMIYTPPVLIRQLLERLDNVVYDIRMNVARGTLRENEHNIVIVDYDQKSLNQEGQWPWSRFKIGQMVQNLADYGALVVGFDVFFPEYERNIAVELNRRLEADPSLQEGMEDLLPELSALATVLDADRYFAESMEITDVVLGFSFRRNESNRTGILPQPIFNVADAENWTLSIDEQQGYIGNVDILQNAANGAGFFDTFTDIDGVIRRSPLFMQFQGKLFPSLSLDMARLYYFEDEFTPEITRDSLDIYSQLIGIRMGQILIPTDQFGGVLVPYLGPSGSFPYISATDVLNGTLTDEQKELLINSLVLVGTTATGLYDLRATPVEAVYPGVEIHANILNALLSSSVEIEVGGEQGTDSGGGALSSFTSALNAGKQSPFPSRPDWEKAAVTTAIFVIGIMLSLSYPYLGPGLLALSSATFILGLVFLNFQLWTRYNLDISLVILLLLILVITNVNMAYGFMRESITKKAIKGMFDQYVPPAHIDAMLNDPEKYNFDGESKELSVLFLDIRGFTTISEKLTAVQLKAMLNDFFTPMTAIIFQHQGTIDKYVGDMIMAFWGAPLDDPRHREHAVTAALKMLARVEELQPVFQERGIESVRIGVGINSGMMSVGDMGSTYRRSYTVLGDAVNLGSRLESITKAYGLKLLIGEQTYDQLKGYLCRQVDKVMVKGKDQPIRIYEPLCLESEASEEILTMLDEYQRAYKCYLEQRWDDARALFELLQRKEPDTYLYALYLGRIASLREEALPEDWDGAYRFTTK